MRGFTLVEILVAISIMMSLILMASGVYIHYLSQADEDILRQNVSMLRASIQQFYSDHGRYPYDGLDYLGNRVAFLDTATSELTQGVHNSGPPSSGYPVARHRYLHEIPIDPTTNLANWYILPADNDGDWKSYLDWGPDNDRFLVDAGQGNGYHDVGEDLRDDVGEDGSAGSNDTGEGDGFPTRGEPRVDEDPFGGGDNDGDGRTDEDPPDVMSVRSSNKEFSHL